MEVLMSIGDVAFYTVMPGRDAINFENVTRDSQFTWTAQGRLGRDPAFQFTGPGEESFTVEGRIYPHFFGGVKSLEQLRDMGRAGEPHVLVRYSSLDESDPGNSVLPVDPALGLMGTFSGRVVIRRVRRADTKIASTGIANRIDFTLELTRFGDDPEGNSDFLFATAAGTGGSAAP
jgi:uncharacterized protein